jgi:hypothetical protein
VAVALGIAPRHSFRSPTSLGRWVGILVGTSAAWSVVNAALSYGWTRRTRFVLIMGRGIRPTLPSLFPRPILAFISLLGLAAEIAWLFWQHRVTQNVWARGIEMKTSPAWAVGWWFIPVANLWMPAVALYRVYRASVGRMERAGVWFIAAWWTAFVLPIVVAGTALVRMARPWFRAIQAISRGPNTPVSVDLTRGMHVLGQWAPAIAVTQIVAAGLAITIVTRIDEAQEAMRPPIPGRPDIGPGGEPRR